MDIVDANELEISAKEAYFNTKMVRQNWYETEIKDIFKKIRKASLSGDFEIYEDKYLCEETVATLKSLGYTLTELAFEWNNVSIKISWEDVVDKEMKEASEAEDKEWGTWEERMKVINDGT